MLKHFGLAAIALALAVTTHAAPIVLNRGNLAEPETLDPQKTYTDDTGNITLDMFVGLTTYDAAANPIPGAAQSWTVTPDGLTYTFKLRPNMVWSDGAPLTAEDMAFGIRRAMDPKTASQLANLGFCIKNGIPVNSGNAPLDTLGVRVADPATIEIKVEAPCPTLIAALAEPAFAPMPSHIFKKYGDDWVKPGIMVSNGPFTLADWRPNDHVRLVKNPRFYDAANVKIDEVIFYPIDDDTAALKRFRAGDLDMNQRISPSDIAWLRKNMPGIAHTTIAAGVNYIAIDHDRTKFKDSRVRRALALGIDRDMIAAKLMKLGETPANGMVPPIGAFYRNQTVDFATTPFAARQAEARKLLAAAGYTAANPLTFTLRQRAGAANQRIAIGLQNMWAQIGVKAEILTTELKTHYASMNMQDFDVGLVGLFWPNDPEYFLADLVETAATNYGHYRSPAYNAKMREAQAQVDPTKRYTRFAEAEAIALKDIAMIPVYFAVTRNIVAPYVKGFVDNPRDFHMSRYLRIENRPAH